MHSQKAERFDELAAGFFFFADFDAPDEARARRVGAAAFAAGFAGFFFVAFFFAIHYFATSLLAASPTRFGESVGPSGSSLGSTCATSMRCSSPMKESMKPSNA